MKALTPTLPGGNLESPADKRRPGRLGTGACAPQPLRPAGPVVTDHWQDNPKPEDEAPVVTYWFDLDGNPHACFPGVVTAGGFVGGAGAGGGASIPSNLFFADATDRDEYFIDNPAELIPGIAVAIDNGAGGWSIQQWTGSAWVDITSVFVGPQGPPGQNGQNGAQGPQGVAGPPGAPSTIPGPQGPPGTAGAPGAASTVPGPAGPQGPAGSQGPMGPAGPMGTGIAYQGTVATADDLPGPPLPDGAMFITADDGHGWVWNGNSFDDIGQMSGVAGPEGPQGPIGPMGPAGANSTVPGPAGPQGPAGSAGSVGPAGQQGNPGIPSFAQVTAPFVVPAIGASVTVSLANVAWCQTGAPVFIAGMFGVITAISGSTITVQRIEAEDLQTAITEAIVSAPFVPQNYADNSGFTINQRAYVSGTALAAGAYGFDRWRAGTSGATLLFTQTPPLTYITVSAGSILQIIEGLNLLSVPHTLAWSGSAQGRAYPASGTPGNYAGPPLTFTPAQGTNHTIEFAGGTLGRLQLQIGTMPTPWQPMPAQQELARCQRFYQIIQPLFGQYNNGGVGSLIFGTSLLVALRSTLAVIPSINVITSSISNFSVAARSISNNIYWVNGSCVSTGSWLYNETLGISMDFS